MKEETKSDWIDSGEYLMAMRFANHLGRNYFPISKWILIIDGKDWYLRKYVGGSCLITCHGKGKPGELIPLPKGVSPHQVEIDYLHNPLIQVAINPPTNPDAPE